MIKLKILNDSTIPIYQQISQGIVELVSQGELKVGDQLPTERKLAENLSVARGTISKAYEILNRQSVIEVIQGSGAFIAKSSSSTGDRKARATKILEEAIDEVSRMRFSPEEISHFFQLLLLKREDDHCEVRVLCIDCNVESLSLFEKQFLYLKNIKMTKMLLSDFLRTEKLHNLLESYDLILTTTTHYREIIARALKFKEKILQCSLMMARQTIVDLSQIQANAKIGILCETRRFYDIIHRHLVEMHIAPEAISYLSENSEKEILKKFLSKKQVIICRPQIFGENFTSMSSMGEFLGKGGSLIYFNYQIDRGTLSQVEDRVNEIIREKVSG